MESKVATLIRIDENLYEDIKYLADKYNRSINKQIEYIVQIGKKTWDYFETYMNTTWTFADGTSETKDAVLGNAPNNTKPIRCEVILNETGEVVYKTGVLPVGAVLEPFKLDKDLDAGTYEAICQIYLLKEQEDGTYADFSSAGFYVTIEVEN